MSLLRLHNPEKLAGPEPGTLDYLADRYKRYLRERMEAGEYEPPAFKNVVRYIDSFLAFIYTQEGKGGAARIGALPLAQAKQVHLTTWLLANFDRWKSGSTRGDALGAVLGCFNTLEEQQLIDSHPFRRPKHLKFPRKHRRAMRTQHFRAVYWAASRQGRKTLPFRLMLFACWYTGVRLGEFRKLEPHEIDWDAVVRLGVDKNKTGRKTGEERIIGVGNRLLNVLWGLCQRRKKDGKKFVFLTPRGRPWSKDHLGREFAKFRELAGVPEHIKMCASRHGYAFRILSDGQTSTKAVADQLGHKGTRMVESIYGAETRHDAEGLKTVAAKAERGRKPAQKASLESLKRRDERRASPLFEGLRE